MTAQTEKPNTSSTEADIGSPCAWRADFERGDVTRLELWRLFSQRHRLFAEHSAALTGTEIAALVVGTDGLSVKLSNGLAFSLDPDALREAPNVVLAQGEYESFEMSLISRLAQDARVIFDIGANIGWYSLHLAAQERQAKIFAFEPVPTTHARLLGNLARNEAGRRIAPIADGLSDQPGVFDMFVPATSGSPAASLNDLHPGEGSRKVECRFTTLDAFVADNKIESLDFLKCDVEGAELRVLRGGARTIEKMRPAVVIELLRKWSAAFGYHPNDVIGLFHSLGYECWGIGSHELTRIAAVTDETVETNYVFLDPARHPPAQSVAAAVAT